ncbi:hypothetical protein [Caulobacter segnis]|uniref:hypothetical protein n=1 Tax=Caulobacter segnis TaxID=88688 RepID=UPI001CBEC102|nr:hypothetical protein [Caulobacter segnis]UAL10175.1 hypothetical protein K8940_20795 [Caulobacter segnis]
MKMSVLALSASMLLAPTAHAGELAPGLRGLSFLVGGWKDAKGVVADTGGTSTGRSSFTAEAGGAVLLRRDHTELFDKTGKPSGGFDQIMMIYPEGDGLRADYSDGEHVIHYDRAEIDPGKAVTFTSVAQPGRPVFRLSYRLPPPDRLSVSFAMAPPGSATVQPIADGFFSRAN